jgi:hypothetical protein
VYASWKQNGGFDKKEAVLMVLGLLLVAHFDTLSDSKFEILVIMLVVGVGIVKAVDIWGKMGSSSKPPDKPKPEPPQCNDAT